jgi:hypothetical protein
MYPTATEPHPRARFCARRAIPSETHATRGAVSPSWRQTSASQPSPISAYDRTSCTVETTRAPAATSSRLRVPSRLVIRRRVIVRCSSAVSKRQSLEGRPRGAQNATSAGTARDEVEMGGLVFDIYACGSTAVSLCRSSPSARHYTAISGCGKTRQAHAANCGRTGDAASDERAYNAQSRGLSLQGRASAHCPDGKDRQ